MKILRFWATLIGIGLASWVLALVAIYGIAQVVR